MNAPYHILQTDIKICARVRYCTHIAAGARRQQCILCRRYPLRSDIGKYDTYCLLGIVFDADGDVTVLEKNYNKSFVRDILNILKREGFVLFCYGSFYPGVKCMIV